MNDNEREAILNAKVVSPFGITQLCARRHEQYHGPVRAWAGTFWIFYNDQPVEVVRLHGDSFVEK